ncbi:hypothetical protein Ciccas_012146 [Cichlidogyrus casuarinus]|uniref:Actin interacting protein 3-like C-terminal domain-containing protein n=1 Tax=Cichlidogyrus casuarinus TaxID=1844966 RepID=A0ABD2PQ52_9PLAT
MGAVESINSKCDRLLGFPSDLNNSSTPSNSSVDSAFSSRSVTDNNHTAVAVSPLTITPPLKLCVSSATRERLRSLNTDCVSLQTELDQLRSNNTAIQEELKKNSALIMKEVNHLSALGQQKAPERQAREAIDASLIQYREESQELDAWLNDLDAVIEEFRNDALARRCKIKVTEMETLALHLSRISRRLASHKS